MEKTMNVKSFTRFETLAMAFYFLVEINVELFVHRPVYIAAVVLLMLAFFCSRIVLRFNTYLLWILLWAGTTAVSLIYSINTSYTFTALLTILARGAAVYLIISKVETKEQLVKLLKIFIDVVTVNLLYIFTRVDVTTLGVSRIGANTIESDSMWNSNSIGTVLAIAVAIIFILLKYKQFEGVRKKIAYLQLIAFAIVTALCGSRMALFIMVGIPLLIYLFSAKSNIPGKKIAVIAVVLIAVYWLIMNVPVFYSVLGSRVEKLFLFFEGETVSDGSINSRKKLVEYGMRWFSEKPLFGYGMYTFMHLSKSYFSYAWYAHNNYVEVLVGTGVVGFVAYYWYYIHVLFETIKRKLPFRDIIVPIMVVLMITEFGTVSFKSFALQFVLGLVTILFKFGLKEMAETN